MNRSIVVSLAGISLLALAACGEGEKKSESESVPPARTETMPAETGQTGAAPEVSPPAETAPADNQGMAPAGSGMDQAIDGVQGALDDAVASMTDEQKQAAIASARAEAEAAARNAGRSEEMIKQLGDQAEAAAKQALGIE